MSALGKVRIGHKAPDFHCEAVMKGVIEGTPTSRTPRTVAYPYDHNRSQPQYLYPSFNQARRT